MTIAVAGCPVPFLDVFLALSRGEPHLLLPDGAYFSLDKPELRALARLIEEARTLQDAPGGPLRISRYQAGLRARLRPSGGQAGRKCWVSGGPRLEGQRRLHTLMRTRVGVL